MGEGEEIVGIAGHLDIVPVGGDWTYDPFKLTREGDHVYGRGTTDDKGPVLEALYAMKLVRDSGVKLNKRVRLIMGCNEETGSKCMEHYNEVEEELSCGFTPDASFPCIHGEKGQMGMMAYSKNTKIISMNGGFVSNAVCDTCNTVVPAEAGLKDAYGILQFIQEPYVLSFFQVCCDYILAFAALGVAGFFAKQSHGLLKGYIVAVIARGAFHALGGYLYWMSYMPDNFPKSLTAIYPIVYNYSYLLAEGIITVIVISIPAVSKALAQVKKAALGTSL